MGYTYSVTITNHSSHSDYFMLFQNDPGSWDPKALTAWAGAEVESYGSCHNPRSATPAVLADLREAGFIPPNRTVYRLRFPDR